MTINPALLAMMAQTAGQAPKPPQFEEEQLPGQAPALAQFLALMLGGASSGLGGQGLPMVQQQLQGQQAAAARVQERNVQGARGQEMTRYQEEVRQAEDFQARQMAYLQHLQARDLKEQMGQIQSSLAEQQHGYQVDLATIQNRAALDRLVRSKSEDLRNTMAAMTAGQENTVANMLAEHGFAIKRDEARGKVDLANFFAKLKPEEESRARLLTLGFLHDNDMIDKKHGLALEEMYAKSEIVKERDQQLFTNRITELETQNKLGLASELEVLKAKHGYRDDELATMHVNRIHELFRQHELGEKSANMQLEREKLFTSFKADIDLKTDASMRERERGFQRFLSDVRVREAYITFEDRMMLENEHQQSLPDQGSDDLYGPILSELTGLRGAMGKLIASNGKLDKPHLLRSAVKDPGDINEAGYVVGTVSDVATMRIELRKMRAQIDKMTVPTQKARMNALLDMLVEDLSVFDEPSGG